MEETADSYFLLEDAQEREFLDCTRLSGQRPSCELEQALGVDPREVVFARSERPASALLDSMPRARLRARDLTLTARLLVQTRRDIRRRPIGVILAGLRVPDANATEPGDGSAVRTSAIPFLAARRLVPIRHNCLLDSIALVRWLVTKGCPVTLVFGAKLHPFAAHCWVQSGTLLLNDRLETVHRFEPVRVIPCAPVTS